MNPIPANDVGEAVRLLGESTTATIVSEYPNFKPLVGADVPAIELTEAHAARYDRFQILDTEVSHALAQRGRVWFLKEHTAAISLGSEGDYYRLLPLDGTSRYIGVICWAHKDRVRLGDPAKDDDDEVAELLSYALTAAEHGRHLWSPGRHKFGVTLSPIGVDPPSRQYLEVAGRGDAFKVDAAQHVWPIYAEGDSVQIAIMDGNHRGRRGFVPSAWLEEPPPFP